MYTSVTDTPKWRLISITYDSNRNMKYLGILLTKDVKALHTVN